MRLAKALAIPVTAEGIETVGQTDLLRKAGCDQLQGFHDRSSDVRRRLIRFRSSRGTPVWRLPAVA
jgi:sensor c-di-GMP phosphodiesterase-like protein